MKIYYLKLHFTYSTRQLMIDEDLKFIAVIVIVYYPSELHVPMPMSLVFFLQSILNF
jgi:hypothetical protein